MDNIANVQYCISNAKAMIRLFFKPKNFVVQRSLDVPLSFIFILCRSSTRLLKGKDFEAVRNRNWNSGNGTVHKRVAGNARSRDDGALPLQRQQQQRRRV
jgi:hypothetical protein